MNILHRDAFTVAGLEARTTNAREMTAEGVIPKLWGRVMREGLLATLPNRADSAIIALYTDYESDKDGPYTFVIGARVTGSGKVPGGMIETTVASGDYALFRAENPAKDAVVQLWAQIWSLESEHKLSRAYRTDYEVHRFGPGGEASVEVYVGVKK